MLRSVGWFRTDVSGLRIGPTFKRQDVQEEGPWYESTGLYRGEERRGVGGNRHSESANLANKVTMYGQHLLW